MKRVYVTGVSGTGKTTIAEELKKRGVNTLSIEETPTLCYWINNENAKKVDYEAKLNKEFIKTHKWVCDLNYLKQLLNEYKDDVIVTGSTSNLDYSQEKLFDKILLLKTSPEIFIERIKNRKNNPFGKDKSAQEHILSWYKEFEDRMIEKGAIPIDAGQPIEKVAEQILKHINS